MDPLPHFCRWVLWMDEPALGGTKARSGIALSELVSGWVSVRPFPPTPVVRHFFFFLGGGGFQSPRHNRSQPHPSARTGQTEVTRTPRAGEDPESGLMEPSEPASPPDPRTKQTKGAIQAGGKVGVWISWVGKVSFSKRCPITCSLSPCPPKKTRGLFLRRSVGAPKRSLISEVPNYSPHQLFPAQRILSPTFPRACMT